MSLENEFYLAALFDDPSRLYGVFDHVIRTHERVQYLVNDRGGVCVREERED